MKILIAEDEVSIAKALKVMLEKNRYTVDMVYNGTDALDYGLQGAYDAMVLDVMMPGMNGLEVLRTLRSRGVSTPALFLTAKGEVEDRVEEYGLWCVEAEIICRKCCRRETCL